MTEQQLLRMANRRLAILRHAEEITGNVALTCRYYGISRQCFYTWRRRYDAHGLDGLRDRSHRPHISPNATRTGHPVAALVHDAALNEESPLVQAVAATARMTIENERLQAEVRAQLDEVRASRARIVEFGDAERRRVERNLHDGAQQRLVNLSLALGIARSQVGTSSGKELAEALDEAAAELRLALAELRELARGIHPVILTEAGLGPALASLAERSPIAVTVAAVPPDRLPPQVEEAAYYVASESLANAAKHAQATTVTISARRRSGRLLVEVVDDGVGGADPSGSGLRGLADRVAAVDGHLRVSSPAGTGTCITAELPCG